MKDLEFGIDIAAPVARVWDCMFDPIAYRDWTSAFCDGSYFEGQWEAIVDEAVKHEKLSLRLVGEIKDGRPVTDSALHREPAHERYVFSTTPAGTHLAIHLQSWDDGFTDFLQTSWPQALKRLKDLSESTH